MTSTAELGALRATINQSLARIDQLEAEAVRDEERTTRRGMLRLAGAAAVGGLAATIAADPVAATDGAAVLAGVPGNTATLPTGIAASASSKAYGLGCYETGLGALDAYLGQPAVFGHATNNAFSVGVAGHSAGTEGVGVLGRDTGPSTFGIGTKGRSLNGIGVDASGGFVGVNAVSNGVGVYSQGLGGALLLGPVNLSEPSLRVATYAIYTLDTDGAGNVWFCYESGSPGKWRKLAGPDTGGAFHPITPTRVYDSRAAAPSPGLLTNGNNRLVSVADGRNGAGVVTAANIVAAGATAVAANITITGTTGGFGYLAINPGGNTVEGASTINWFGAGQTIANGVTLTLNASRQLTVICGGGAGASTHFIIDIAGYYL